MENYYKKYINWRNFIIAVVVKLVIFTVFTFSFNGLFAEAAIAVNKNVRQVKTPDSSTIYYLDHSRGLKKAYVNEKAFLSYGNDWMDVMTINKSVLDKWPDAHLVKSDNNPAVYYINNSKKCLLKSSEEFEANNFGWDEIITINDTDLNGYKSVDDCKFLIEKYSIASEGTADSLEVTLDPSTPKADYLPYGTRGNIIAIFDLKANDNTALVDSLTVEFKGVYSFDEIENLTLVDSLGAEYDVIQTRTDGKVVTFGFNPPLSVDSSYGRKVAVVLDLKTQSAGSNHSIKAVLNGYSSVKTSSYVYGNWPVSANEFKFIDGGSILAMVRVTESSIVATGGKTEAVIGSTEKIIGKFKVSETSGRQELAMSKISFKNKGTAIYPDLANFKLKHNSSVIAQTKSAGADNVVTFDTGNYKISKGNSVEFTVSADIISGENKTINLDYDDIQVIDNNYKFKLNADSTDLTEAISIKREAIGVSAKENKAGSKTHVNEAGVLIGNFEIKNGNKNVNFDSMVFSMKKNAGAPSLSETVSVVNYDTGFLLGYINGAELSENNSNIYIKGLSLKTQQNIKIGFITTIPDSAKSGDNYKITLKSVSYFTDNNLYFTDEVNTAGNTFTVSKSKLFVYANDEAEMSYAKGQKNVKIASFNAEASAGDAVILQSITLSDGSETSAHVTYENGFGNLKLYVNGTRANNTIAVPNGGSFTFEGLSYRLSSDNRVEIKIYADTEKDMTVSEAQMQIVKVTAKSASSNIPTTITNINVNSLKSTFGTVAAKMTAISGGSASTGTKGNLVASLKVENTGAEKIYLKTVVVDTDSDGFTKSLGYSNLKIVNRDTNSVMGSVSSPIAGANTLSLGSFALATGEMILDVYIDANSNIPSQEFNIVFRELKARGKTSDISAVVEGDPTDSVHFVSSGTGTVTIATTGDTAPATNSSLYWPTDTRKINYTFHDADYPYIGTSEHTGIDIAASQGSQVKAAQAGTVTDVADNTTSELNYIVINHGDGLQTFYAHLSSVKMNAGDKVKAGQLIGYSGGKPGTAGAGEYTTGAHLHFEVVVNGIEVDPMGYLK